MEVLYFFEKLRFPALDSFMQLITEFGSETMFLAVALILYWCVDKKTGYYMVSVGCLGSLFNQFVKLSCRVPRPWALDPDFTIVESARADATGYSFPSGHSQSAVGTFGVLALQTRKRWLKVLSIAIMILVPISRMYLGVHTPKDVLVGSACALLLVFLVRPIVYSKKTWAFPALMALMIAGGLAFACYVQLAQFPADIDQDNLAHAVKNSYTFLGSMAAFLLTYILDEKLLHFDVKARFWVQLVKIALGLGLTVGLKALLKAPLYSLLGQHPAVDGLRYFLVVIFAALLWPMTFSLWNRLGGTK